MEEGTFHESNWQTLQTTRRSAHRCNGRIHDRRTGVSGGNRVREMVLNLSAYKTYCKA